MSADVRLPGGSAGRRATLAITLTVAAVLVLAVGGMGYVVLHREAGRCPAAIEAVEADESPTAVTTISIDVASNSDRSREALADRLVPDIRAALNGGSGIELVIDPGAGAPLAHSSCLDGQRAWDLDRSNATTEAQDRAAGEAAIRDLIVAELAANPAQETGGPLRLLREAERASVSNPEASPVVLVTDFLANDETCLDATAVTADVAGVEQVVAACAGDLPEIDRPIVVLGAGSGHRAEGREQFALDLSSQICTTITTKGCEVR